MKIGIIGAMEEEIDAILALSEELTEEERGTRSFRIGSYGGQTFILTRCDVGKVNGAMATQSLIDHYAPDLVMKIGSAGAISPELDVGDIVIATEALQHDVDLTGWGLARGEVMFDATLTEDTGMLNFRTQGAFPTDEELTGLVHEVIAPGALHPVGERIPAFYRGRVVSSDAFISDPARVREIRDAFDPLCSDMETAAVAHVCTVNDVPFVSIQAISDKADGSAALSFHTFLKDATRNYAEIVRAMFERL